MKVDDLLYWSMDLKNFEEESELNDNDFNKLLRSLKKHKLFLKFYHKVTTIQTKWLSESQRKLLELTYEKQMKSIGEKVAFLEELSKLTEEKKVDYVIVKGLSTYFLLGEVENIRTSKDIDILSSNEQELVQLLEGLGFMKVDKEYPQHEYVSMRRGDVEFDIHKYIPVSRYHSGLIKCIENLDRNRTWLISERENQLVKDITFRDLETQLSKGIITTNITMHAFIRCLNIFRDYYDAVGHEETIGVTLFDLLELKELAGDAHFNINRFLELVTEFKAWDAIRFSDMLLQHFFRISLYNTTDSIKNFPFRVTWSGVWAIPNSIESLISRSFDDLNRSFLPVINLSQRKLLEKELEGYNSHIVNFLKGIEVSKTELYYSISITMPCSTSWVKDCFTMKLSKDVLYIWECNGGSFDPISINEGIRVSYHREYDRYTVQLRINHQQILNETLTLCIDRWGGTGVLVTYIPIIL